MQYNYHTYNYQSYLLPLNYQLPTTNYQYRTYTLVHVISFISLSLTHTCAHTQTHLHLHTHNHLLLLFRYVWVVSYLDRDLTIRYMIRYDTIRYDTIRYDMIRYDTIRYDMTICVLYDKRQHKFNDLLSYIYIRPVCRSL